MNSQGVPIERRQRNREGVMAEIEDVTFRILRRYGVEGPTEPQPLNPVEKSA